MRRIFFKIAMITLLSVFFRFAQAQFANQVLRFDHITIDDGISQNTISCILQDKEGFMWFGTQDGLNRYDGYRFDVHRYDRENPKSISNNVISSICETRSGMICIGTNNGLNIYSPEFDNFKRYFYNSENTNSISNNNITSVYEDRSGVLWIGTVTGLNRFDPDSGRFYHYYHKPNEPTSLSHNFVLTIYEDHLGVLWVGTENGLNRFNPDSNSFIQYYHEQKEPTSISHDRVQSIYEDHLKELWIGTQKGLNRFDHLNKRFTRYYYDPQNPSSISHNNILSIYEDKSNVLWIGTVNQLNRFDRLKNQFIRYSRNEGDPASLSNNYILSLYQDRSGVLWIGTYGGGLNTFTNTTRYFVQYRNLPNDPNSLNNNDVLSLYEDEKGVLWIGTNGGGVNRFDHNKNQFIHYRNNPQNMNSISSDYVRSICQDQSGTIWFGTDGGGLNRFIENKNKFIRYQMNSINSNSLSHNTIRSIRVDSKGFLWICTLGGGLNRFDPRTEQFYHYKSVQNDSQSIAYDYVYTVYEDRSGTIWVGTDGRGLDKLVLNDNEVSHPMFIHYQNNPDDSNSISNNRVMSICESRSGILWIGTYNGLNQFDRKNEIFKCYTEKEGLPNSMIYGILEDDFGNLWMSTNNGLSKFNPQSGLFHNYDVSNGLQSNEFWGGSCFKNDKGEMFFGGVNGFNVFYPDSIRGNLYVPPIVITDFQIFNQSVSIGQEVNGRVILDRSITKTDNLRLSYKNRSFSFEFASLNYIYPQGNRYRFFMEGFEKEWNDTGARRFVTYTALSHGDYKFHVKGSNNDGLWNEEGVSIKIKIIPPFWQTWWFRGLCMILILSAIYTIYSIRTQSIKRRNRELEKHVKERTKKLKATMSELKVSNNRLIQTTGQLESINTELQDFAHIVSHDLKAPLRGVSQLADWIVKDNQEKLDDASTENLNLLQGRVKRMDNLIDGILQYSRAGRTQGEKTEVDLNVIVRNIIEDLAPPKHIQVEIENTLPVIQAEEVKIQQVFQNLISNAIKYMDKSQGKVQVGSTEKSRYWEFHISDNGPGIEKKYHETIFKIFQTLEARDERESTGVGLSVVKKIVEKNGGKIWVESKLGEGSTFYFTVKK